MSVLHIKQIEKKINELFSNYLDLSDLSDSDKDRQAKINTRCLAAYAVYTMADCTAEEAASAVVDGGGDNGIDAIFCSASLDKLILVQSKWSHQGNSSPSQEDVLKFCQGVRDIINADFERFNAKIKLKEKTIEKALTQTGVAIKLIFIDTNSNPQIAEAQSRNIEDLCKQMNNVGDENSEEIMTFDRFHQGEVYKRLSASDRSKPIDIQLSLREWGQVSEPYLAFYGVASGEEVVKWWHDFGTQLFEKNIRQNLGKTDINDELEKTIKTAPQNFWYFNNGITIIADDVQKVALGGGSRDIGIFDLKDVAVINGAQTVSSIGKYYSNDVPLKLMVRIIKISGTTPYFDRDITRSNNRQNRIENRDFVSQDPEQKRIQTELRFEKVTYSIMRYDGFESSENSFDVDEALIALACASGKSSLVTQTKGAIGKFYESFDKGGYKELFNPSTTGIFVQNAVKTVRSIERCRSKKLQELQERSGKNYGTIVHGNRMLSLLVISKLNLAQNMKNHNYVVDDAEISRTLDGVFDSLVTILTNDYRDNFLGSLFKNSTKCQDVYSKVLNLMPDL